MRYIQIKYHVTTTATSQIMPLTDKQRQFFSLYRRILRVHEKKLPFEMRVLGNLFVKWNVVL